MAAIIDGKHILISLPRYDQKLEAWHAYASVCWHGDEDNRYVLGQDRTFLAEKEALAFGYAACRAWVDQRASMI